MTHWGQGPKFFCLFLANLIHSNLSLSVDSCLQTSSLNLKDTGSKQTGRKVRVHLVSQLKLWPVCVGRHHNRKGWTDSRGSGQGWSRRLRHMISMNHTVGNTHQAQVNSQSRWEVRVRGFDGNLERKRTDYSKRAGISLEIFSTVKYYTVC